MFITFEGGEGAGKSTQARALAQALRARGRKVTTTREPGGTPEGEALRALLLGPGSRWGAMEEALLLFAARRVHVERVIRPALARGEVVVCDRFTDSTRAYQGHAGDLGPEAVEALDRLVLQGFGPDLTFVLDLPVEAAFARIHGGNGDRFEGRALAFHEALRRGYRAVAASFPERCALVNAAQDPDALAAEILTLALKRLGPARGG